MNPVERITLQQAKALVEKRLNKNIWRELERDFVWDEIVTAWDEAAELYARSKWDEACETVNKMQAGGVYQQKPEFKP